MICYIEWRRENSRGFDGNGLEEGQYVVAIVCMEANISAAAVLAEACFALPGFFVSAAAVLAEAGFALPGFFASAASIVTTLSLSLALSALLEGSASDAHSVMEQAKIFRSSPASD